MSLGTIIRSRKHEVLGGMQIERGEIQRKDFAVIRKGNG